MRCWFKYRNERNPYVQLLVCASALRTLDRLPHLNEEEGGDDVKSVWPLRPGLHTCYNAWHNGKQDREVEQIPKTRLSSDWSLQFDSMKLESLVTAYQLRRREYVPGPCTHRPSHHESRERPKSAIPRPTVSLVIGMKS